jgi:hypothetical protein
MVSITHHTTGVFIEFSEGTLPDATHLVALAEPRGLLASREAPTVLRTAIHKSNIS